MDYFTPYGNHFQKSLSNTCKFKKKYIEMNFSLTPEKCDFLMNEGIVLGHFLYKEGIQIEPNNISIV